MVVILAPTNAILVCQIGPAAIGPAADSIAIVFVTILVVAVPMLTGQWKPNSAQMANAKMVNVLLAFHMSVRLAERTAMCIGLTIVIGKRMCSPVVPMVVPMARVFALASVIKDA